jgi:tellurite resistance protein TerA
MTDLQKGANAPLDVSSIDVAVTGAAQGAVDLMIFQLTDAHRVRSDADFVFFNQPQSAEGAVRMTAPDRITVQLPAVPPEVSVLAVAVALDDSVPGSLATVPGLAVTVNAGSTFTATASGLTSERAAVLVELYRRGDAWKLRNVSAGWAEGLAALVLEHGVSIDDTRGATSSASSTPVASFPPPSSTPAASFPPPASTPAASFPPAASAPAAPFPAPAPTPAAPSRPPASAPAANLPPPASQPVPDLPSPTGKVDLGKRSGAISLTKGQRVAIDSSELIVASISWPPATDYDVYALIRYRDGRTETVSAFGTQQNPQFSLTSSDGAVRHAGDVGRADQHRLSRKEKKAMAAQGVPAAGAVAVERIEIRPHAGIQAIVPVAYSAQSNGTGSFRRYQVSMSIDNGRGTTVRIDAPNADDNDLIYSCVPGIILITDQGVVIDSLEQYSQPTSERRPLIAPDLQVTMDAGDTNLYK